MKTKAKHIFFYTLMVLCFYSVCANATVKIIKIKIQSGTYSDEIAVRFMPGATLGFDGCCDAWKLFSGNNAVPQLFTRTNIGDELAINSLPSSNNTDELDLFVRTGAATSYSITATQLDSFSVFTGIILVDNVTGNMYDLKTMGTYVINLPAIAVGSPARFGVKIITPPVLMPVELTRFSGTSVKEGVKILWSTASEENSESFFVERAVLSDFPGSGEMQYVIAGYLPGAGNSSSEKHYEFVDQLPVPEGDMEEKMYYRLKQTDFNGVSHYYGPIAVYREKNNSDLLIYPTVSNGNFYIAGNLYNTSAEVYSMAGELMLSTVLNSTSEMEPAVINMISAPSGVYFLKMIKNNESVTYQIIVSK